MALSSALKEAAYANGNMMVKLMILLHLEKAPIGSVCEKGSDGWPNFGLGDACTGILGQIQLTIAWISFMVLFTNFGRRLRWRDSSFENWDLPLLPMHLLNALRMQLTI